MSSWYELVPPSEPLTQGDLIFDCPVPTWQGGSITDKGGNDIDDLKAALEFISVDLVVVTQACDLAHDKVRNVTLCPHTSLSEVEKEWKAAATKAGGTASKKAWERLCKNLNSGYVWNQTILNRSNLKDFEMEFRVVDFYEVFTLPKSFLQAFVANRNMHRIRLLPPYREHLSQAFARFYMRVGLPTDIQQVDLESMFSAPD